jgi:hypothetical protein
MTCDPIFDLGTLDPTATTSPRASNPTSKGLWLHVNLIEFMQKKKKKKKKRNIYLRFDTWNVFTVGKVYIGSVDTDVKILY